MNKYLRVFLLLIGFVGTGIMLLNGCSPKEEAAKEYSDSATGDIREETKSVKVLPDFLTNQSEDLGRIYKAVASHKEVVEKMPCFCGCGESVGHKSNYDCFVYSDPSGEKIVWDDHATKCGVCLETAVEAINQFENGKSIKTIRKEIEAKYEEGYAEPTPTPSVS
ncbi:PCYCGC domain-containing protein [Halobacillus salinarum]|uniref:PCYCGC domain-containing protein n=1 Tax=Halobacillus salinarum TaxID=2932257 RepID=A0ABY4EHW3_9BACI|nr:PCYCGC domain-containing protein [Halobacillus salinarum]UOQ43711.1 PCYCGC domain-containing protein [Halobacillus salinarum]